MSKIVILAKKTTLNYRNIAIIMRKFPSYPSVHFPTILNVQINHWNNKLETDDNQMTALQWILFDMQLCFSIVSIEIKAVKSNKHYKQYTKTMLLWDPSIPKTQFVQGEKSDDEAA